MIWEVLPEDFPATRFEEHHSLRPPFGHARRVRRDGHAGSSVGWGEAAVAQEGLASVQVGTVAGTSGTQGTQKGQPPEVGSPESESKNISPTRVGGVALPPWVQAGLFMSEVFGASKHRDQMLHLIEQILSDMVPQNGRKAKEWDV